MLKNAAGATRDERSVTYCLGIWTRASSKMHTFAQPGDRVLCVATPTVGEQVRRVSDMDREALERGDFKLNLMGVSP